MTVLLFTTEICSKCPEAKQFLEDNNIGYELMEIGPNAKAFELAQKHEIMHVPAIVDCGVLYYFDEYKLKTIVDMG